MRNYISYLLVSILLAGCQPSTKSNEAVASETNQDTLQTNDTSHIVSTQLNNEDSKVVNTARTYLNNYYNDDIKKNIIDSNSRRFIVDEYDLNADGLKEIFIGLTGMYFCGSGGCTIILLQSDGTLITRFTVAEYPVLIFTERNKGWNDLLISSRGEYHRMKYNGTKYPSNPSVQKVVQNIEKQLEMILDTKKSPSKWYDF